VLTDVRNGWVSVDAAQREYGVVVVEHEDDFIVDKAASAELRADRKRAA
jgi:hypothetical protein